MIGVASTRSVSSSDYDELLPLIDSLEELARLIFTRDFFVLVRCQVLYMPWDAEYLGDTLRILGGRVIAGTIWGYFVNIWGTSR